MPDPSTGPKFVVYRFEQVHQPEVYNAKQTVLPAKVAAMFMQSRKGPRPAPWVMKCDDDSFPVIPKIMRIIDRVRWNRPFLGGKANFYSVPYRCACSFPSLSLIFPRSTFHVILRFVPFALFIPTSSHSCLSISLSFLFMSLSFTLLRFLLPTSLLYFSFSPQ